MYTQFFNLREMPFNITPDPAYLYLSSRHQEALGHLLYGTGQYGGFVQLTGEVGTGKTTVVRTLLEQKLDDVDVAMIHNPRQNEQEFVQSICDELGVDYPREGITLKTLVDALNAQLLRVHAAGRRTVLIIDEAQNLPRDVLEQVRLLTNLETHKEKLLRIMLIGQPELAELLARPDLRQLASRITARYHLMPLSEAETDQYIRHRLRVAGSTEELFPAAAVREIQRYSRGVPRLINILCDRALLGAYSLGLRRVTAEIVRKAAAESLGDPPADGARRHSRPGFLGRWRRNGAPLVWLEALLAVVALAVAGALLYQALLEPQAAETAATVAAAAPTQESRARPMQAAMPAPRALPSPAIAASHAASAPAGAVSTAATPTDDAAPGTMPPPGTELITLLRSTQPLPAVVSRLIRLWDRDLVIPRGENVCRELSAHDLECYRSTGEWADLRALDRPAILSLSTGRGELQHVLLRGLSATIATVDTAQGALAIPLEQLDALWTGEFLLLWRRQFPETYLTSGARGPSILTLRRRVGELLGEPVKGAPSDRYDAALTEQLRRLQAQRGLEADGVVGIRTLIVLGDGLPDTPTLGTRS